MNKTLYSFVSRALPVIAVLLLVYALFFVFNKPEKVAAEPTIAPPVSSYAGKVSGIGITEPKSENIAIGTHLPGIIAQVHVQVGDAVRKGNALFSIDSRETKAQLELAQAQLAAAQVQLEDAQHQLNLYERVKDKRAISSDELSRRRYAAKLANAKVKEARAQKDVLATQLERMTVTAPIDGKILQLNTRPGEFAAAGMAREPLMIMGDVTRMHVRVEIDEASLPRVNKNANAQGFIRGAPGQPIALEFVRKEPYIVPKSSLTGDGSELVDTRVAEVIYAFDNEVTGAQVGQQMDVFIDAPARDVTSEQNANE